MISILDVFAALICHCLSELVLYNYLGFGTRFGLNMLLFNIVDTFDDIIHYHCYHQLYHPAIFYKTHHKIDHI